MNDDFQVGFEYLSTDKHLKTTEKEEKQPISRKELQSIIEQYQQKNNNLDNKLNKLNQDIINEKINSEKILTQNKELSEKIARLERDLKYKDEKIEQLEKESGTDFLKITEDINKNIEEINKQNRLFVNNLNQEVVKLSRNVIKKLTNLNLEQNIINFITDAINKNLSTILKNNHIDVYINENIFNFVTKKNLQQENVIFHKDDKLEDLDFRIMWSGGEIYHSYKEKIKIIEELLGNYINDND